MQHQNPAKVKFHLHNSTHWYPYLFTEEEEDKIAAWKRKLGVFYNFKNLYPPLSPIETKRLTEKVIEAVVFGVQAARSGANLDTEWKKDNRSKQVQHLQKFLRMKENRDADRITEEKFKSKKDKWVKRMKELMPKNYRFNCLPMLFCYS